MNGLSMVVVFLCKSRCTLDYLAYSKKKPKLEHREARVFEWWASEVCQLCFEHRRMVPQDRAGASLPLQLCLNFICYR